MMPTYGKCKDCAAWGSATGPSVRPDHVRGMCKRTPDTTLKEDDDGCWSFITKLRADAFSPLTPEQQRQADELIRRWAQAQKPSHEALGDVGKDGEVDRG